MTAARNTENCMVCGDTLEYLKTAEGLVCAYCGTEQQGHVKCPKGHFVCDGCHGKDARRLIEDLSLTAKSPDPAAIAELMMAFPGLPMLSCDHAFITAGALMAALRNSPYGSRFGEADVREVFARTAQQAHGSQCGLTGVCGIAPAVGAVVSLFLGSRCGTDREQRMVMEAVTRVMAALAELTGPSCCKAYVRAAIRIAAEFYAEKFGIVLPVQAAAVVCDHSMKHPHGCREERCPYYRKPLHDRFAGTSFVPGTTACVT